MPLYLLIDGYNLLHAAGLACARYGPGGLERRRTQLLKLLTRRLTAAELDRTTIVFDAGNAPAGAPRTATIQGMHVVFAQPDGDADTVIETLIARHSAPRRLRVVSSDHRLQQAARRRRALFVDSEAFCDELQRRADADAPQPVSHPPRGASANGEDQVSPEDVAEWLDIFGDIPEARRLEEEANPWKSLLDDASKLTEVDRPGEQ